MKKLIALVLACLMVFATCAAVAEGKKPEDLKLAWIGKGMNNPWFIKVASYAQKEAQTLGVDMDIDMVSEQVDIEAQLTKIEAAIEKGVDAIIISACSSEGVIPTLQKAREKGIKIVNFDTRISDSAIYDAFVGGDDVLGGYKAGKYICEKLGGTGKVGIIDGSMTQSTGIDRHAGFVKALEEYPGIELVAEVGADWRSDLGADAAQTIYTAHPDINAIFAANDTMAVGMVNSLKTMGVNMDDILLVGFDGTLDALKLMLKGDLDADVSLPEIDEAVMGVRLACALAINPDFVFNEEILYPVDLITINKELDSSYSVYEFMAERFPLYGVTSTGYFE